MLYYFDWTYFLVLIGAVICMIASANVKSTFVAMALLYHYNSVAIQL